MIVSGLQWLTLDDIPEVVTTYYQGYITAQNPYRLFADGILVAEGSRFSTGSNSDGTLISDGKFASFTTMTQFLAVEVATMATWRTSAEFPIVRVDLVSNSGDPGSASNVRDTINDLVYAGQQTCTVYPSEISDIQYSNGSPNGCSAGNSNMGFKFEAQFCEVQDADWTFWFGGDFGHGGAIYVDNQLVYERTNEDIWWGVNWNSGDVFTYTEMLGAGTHEFTIYGTEGCCDGANAIQFQRVARSGTTESITHGDIGRTYLSTSALASLCEDPMYNAFALGFSIDGGETADTQITSSLDYDWRCKTSREASMDQPDAGGNYWYESEYDHTNWEHPTSTSSCPSSTISSYANWAHAPTNIEPIGCDLVTKFDVNYDDSTGSPLTYDKDNKGHGYLRAGTGDNVVWEATLGQFEFLRVSYRSDESGSRNTGDKFVITIDGTQAGEIYANNCYDSDETTSTRDYCWDTFNVASDEGVVKIEYIAANPTWHLHAIIGDVETSHCGENNWIGCYLDTSARDLDYRMENVLDKTSCHILCQDYDYFSLQYGEECFCDNNYAEDDQYTIQPDSECWRDGYGAMDCEHGNDGCIGGTWRNAVYNTRGLNYYCVLDVGAAADDGSATPVAE